MMDDLRETLTGRLDDALSGLVDSPTYDNLPDYLADQLAHVAVRVFHHHGLPRKDWTEVRRGDLLRAIEGVLFSTAMERSRGKKVSDQHEALRVYRGVAEPLLAENEALRQALANLSREMKAGHARECNLSAANGLPASPGVCDLCHLVGGLDEGLLHGEGDNRCDPWDECAVCSGEGTGSHDEPRGDDDET